MLDSSKISIALEVTSSADLALELSVPLSICVKEHVFDFAGGGLNCRLHTGPLFRHFHDFAG